MFLCSRGKRLTQTIYLMFFCSYVLMFTALAADKYRYGVSPYVSWGHPDVVRGRQPRSGLMCFLCKLMFLCSRGKRLTQTLYLMFFCSYVLMFTALAAARAHLGNKNKRACFVLHSVCTIFAQVSYKLSTITQI